MRVENNNIRIKDIAKKAGTSTGTVDRVIHNRGEVSGATQEKILRIIKELDYKPNILARSLASKKSIVIATLLPLSISKESYWGRPIIGINKSVSELNQYGITLKKYFFDPDNPSTFTEKTTLILKQHPDGVVIAPSVSREASIFVDLLDKKNIPYVFIDSDIENANPVSRIGQDSFQSGYLSAKLLDYTLPDNALVLIIHIAKELDNQDHLLQREKGFCNYFTSLKNRRLTLKKIEVAGEKSEIANSIIQNGTHMSSIGGIFVTNSKVHHVARLFPKFPKLPRIVGYDLTPDNIKLLKAGKIDFLLCQKPEKQGYNAINALFEHIVKKQPVKLQNYTPIDIITKENLKYYTSF